jgi:hypothetical protein
MRTRMWLAVETTALAFAKDAGRHTIWSNSD